MRDLGVSGPHGTKPVDRLSRMGWLIAVGILVLIAVGFGFVLYNRLVRLRNRTENAWAQVDVQLRRRYDVVPNLVETVKGYAAHEQQTFEAVVTARNRAVAAGGVAEQGAAEDMLTGALRRLFALAEAYPDLKASEGFRQLQGQLVEAEDKIAVARQIYNDATLTYNNAVQTVPSSLIAGIAGFSTGVYFEEEGEGRSVPKVEF